MKCVHGIDEGHACFRCGHPVPPSERPNPLAEWDGALRLMADGAAPASPPVPATQEIDFKAVVGAMRAASTIPPEHAIRCATCDRDFDARDLTQVVFHEGDHKPMAALDVGPGRKVSAAAPVPDAELPDAIREALDASGRRTFDALLANAERLAGESLPDDAARMEWSLYARTALRDLVAVARQAAGVIQGYAAAREARESALRDEVERREKAEDRWRRAHGEHSSYALLDGADGVLDRLRAVLGCKPGENVIEAAAAAERALAGARADELRANQEWRANYDKLASELREARAEVERLTKERDEQTRQREEADVEWRDWMAKADAAEAREAALNAALFRASEVMRVLRKHVTDDTLANLEREIDAAAAALSVPPGARSPDDGGAK